MFLQDPPKPPPSPPEQDRIMITRGEYYRTPTGFVYIIIEVEGFAGFRGTTRYHYYLGDEGPWKEFGEDSVEGHFEEGNWTNDGDIHDGLWLYAELLDASGNRVAEDKRWVPFRDFYNDDDDDNGDDE